MAKLLVIVIVAVTALAIGAALLLSEALPREAAAEPSGRRADIELSLEGPTVVVARDLPPARARELPERPLQIPRRLPATPRGAGEAASGPPQANVVLGPGPQTNVAPTVSSHAFEGLESGDNAPLSGITPPDPQLAVGPDHVVEMVNIVGRIFDKDGNAIDTFLLADFFEVPPGYLDTDPKILYDAMSGRWFASYLSFIDNPASPDEGRLHVAISQTSDPTGAWNVYFIPYVDVFSDYAGIGVTDDKLTLSGNVFDIDGPPGPITPGCGGGGYCGEQTAVIQKSDVLAGLPGGMVGFVSFPIDPNRFTVRPAHSLSSVSDQYLTTWDLSSFDQLTVIRITGTPDDANVMEASATNVTTLFHDSPPPSTTGGAGDCFLLGMNLGPPPCIDSGDFRMLEAVWRDNSLWSSASAICTPPGDGTDRSCAHLVEVETVGAPSVTQDIMAGASGEYYSWPAVRTDGSGNLVASVTRTTPSIFAQARVIGREATDPPNTLSGSTLLRSGEVVHISGRWGDYLGAAVDPSDPSCVWVVGEYAKATVGSDWGTYIAGTTYSGGDCAGAPAKACGDVNDDGVVNSVDAALLLQLGAGLISSLPNEPSGDVNGDGNITSVDAALILQLQAGFIGPGDLSCP